MNKLLKNKKLLTIIIVIIIIIIGIIIFGISKKDEKKVSYDYCYKYNEDENMVTQTIEIYDTKDKLQTEYYIYYKDEVMSYTEGNKAVIPLQRLNLKDHQVIEIMFIKDEKEAKKYQAGYCE